MSPKTTNEPPTSDSESSEAGQSTSGKKVKFDLGRRKPSFKDLDALLKPEKAGCCGALCNMLRLMKPLMCAADRPKNIRWLVAAWFLTLVWRTILGTWISYPIGNITTALSQHDKPGFIKAFGELIFVIVLFIPTTGFNKMARWGIATRWRKWMTNKIMARYFGNENFYHLLDSPALDNPGMRICDDVGSFTKHFVFLSNSLMLMSMRVISFTWVLWSISHWLVFVCWGYSITATLVLVLYFGKKLSETNKNFIQDTANYRAGLLRLRENAESVAFYSASDQEFNWAGQRFFRLIHDQWFNSMFESWLESIRVMLQWTAGYLPYSVMYIEYFNGKIDHGHITQAVWAFRSLLNGFTQLVEDLPQAARINATSMRIIEMLEVLDTRDEQVGTSPKSESGLGDTDPELLSEAVKSGGRPSLCHQTSNEASGQVMENETGELLIKNLCLSTPNGDHQLVQDLSVIVAKSTSLLIVGPSGVGKSSLLRAICGLWEFHQGHVELPRKDTLMFLPQNAYIPDIPLHINTLKSQCLFPRLLAVNSDTEIEMVLRKVNMAHMMSGEGIYTCDDWRKRLSGGEKQRLAMARLLLASPRFCFLDEATSALDDDNEKLLYSTLQQREASYVSVGHKAELYKYHSHVLELMPGGGWSTYRSEEYQPFYRKSTQPSEPRESPELAELIDVM